MFNNLYNQKVILNFQILSQICIQIQIDLIHNTL